MAEKRGRVSHPAERALILQEHLLAHYLSNPCFVDQLREFRRRYRRAFDRKGRLALPNLLQSLPLLEPTQPFGMATLPSMTNPFSPTSGFGVPRPRRPRYWADLVRLCERWGLRCGWAPERLQLLLIGVLGVPLLYPEDLTGKVQAKTDSMPSLGLPLFGVQTNKWGMITFTAFIGSAFAFRPEAPHHISIRIPYDPLGDDWRHAEKSIMEEARRQRDQIRDTFVRAGFPLSDTQPELPRHIHWLYLRVCPQEPYGRPLGWAAIAQRERVSIKTAKAVVTALSSELGIRLPRLPAGRPRRLSD